MDEQSGESEEEEVMGEGIGDLKRRNWYQNEVDEETKGADFRDKGSITKGAISYF